MPQKRFKERSKRLRLERFYLRMWERPSKPVHPSDSGTDPRPSPETSDEQIGAFRDLLNEGVIRLLQAYPYQNKELYDAASYALASGGHRWRPILFLRVSQQLAPQWDLGQIERIACSIELVHTASIMLDDLPAMDNAVLRRGRETCHLKFSQAAALMASFWLCDVAQHFFHDCQTSKAAESGSDLEERIRFVRSQMMLGQMRDLKSSSVSEAEVVEVCRLKSGVLYGFAAASPAYVLGLGPEAKVLERFGDCLGIAYQISDDIADISASAQALGKDVGKDVDRKTIPRLFGLERALELRALYKRRAMSELKRLGKPIDDLAELVEKITRCT